MNERVLKLVARSVEEDGGLRDDVPRLSPRHEQLEAETDQVRGNVEANHSCPSIYQGLMIIFHLLYI